MHRSTAVWGPNFAFSTHKELLTHTVPWCKGGLYIYIFFFLFLFYLFIFCLGGDLGVGGG